METQGMELDVFAKQKVTEDGRSALQVNICHRFTQDLIVGMIAVGDRRGFRNQTFQELAWHQRSSQSLPPRQELFGPLTRQERSLFSSEWSPCPQRTKDVWHYACYQTR